MKKSLMLCACLLSVSTIAQADNSYKFIGLGLSNNSYLTDNEQIKYSAAWTPKIAAGIGYHVDLNKDYSLDSELSIDYSQLSYTSKQAKAADFELTNVNLNENINGKVDTIGLWATARVNRDNLFSTSFAEVSPFVEISVGTIHLDHRGDLVNPLNNNEKNQVTAYKASAGVTFELDKGNRFSLAIGTGSSKPFN